SFHSFFLSSRRRHTRFSRDWSSDVCSSDLGSTGAAWRAYPHRVQGEGFFLAALRKPGERPSAPPARRHAPTSLPPGAAAWSRVHELLLTSSNDTGHVVHVLHAARTRDLSPCW